MSLLIMSKMNNKPALGALFREKREEKGLLVRQVAAVTEMDQAIISRIENGDRLPTKEQLNKLAGLYGLDLKETYSAWLAEKMLRDYGDEPYAPEAFREAHNQILKHFTIAGPGILYNESFGKPSGPMESNKNPPAKRGRKPKKPDNNETQS